jgi:hypothetical protein
VNQSALWVRRRGASTEKRKSFRGSEKFVALFSFTGVHRNVVSALTQSDVHRTVYCT